MEHVVLCPGSAVHRDIVKRDDFPPHSVVESKCMFRHAVCILSWYVTDSHVSFPGVGFVDVICSRADILLDNDRWLSRVSGVSILRLGIARIRIASRKKGSSCV